MELEDQNVETEVTTAIEEEVTNVEEESVETPEIETEETVEEKEEVADETDISIEATQEETNEDNEEKVEESTEDTEENVSEEIEEEEKDYALLENNYKELENKYAEMEAKYQELVAFKEAVDNEKKDALIDSFYMLSDEDKKDVIENKSNYSLEDIEAKLSVICVRKKVNFDLEDSSKSEDKIEAEEKEVATTYTLETDSVTVPAWIAALRSNRDSKE